MVSIATTMKQLFYLVILNCLIMGLVWGQEGLNCKSIEEMTCDDYKAMVLFDGEYLPNIMKCLKYEKFKTPNNALKLDDPTTITFDIEIKAISALDTKNHELVLDFVFKMSWQDDRLKWPDKCLSDDNQEFAIDKNNWKPFWIPLIYIDDIVSVSVVSELKESLTLTMTDSGYVTYGGRYILKTRCSMGFEWFPLDYNVCEVVISLDHDTEQANITMLYNLAEHTRSSDIQLSDFYVTLEKSEISDTVFDLEEDNVKFSTFIMAFSFKRIYSNHLLHTYIPSFMLCSLSACSVYIPSDLIPGRMSLCITTFLSIISLFNGAKASWPTTSYMKSADLWTLFCYIGVFYSLAEYCFILFLTKKSDWEVEMEKSKIKPLNNPELFEKKDAKSEDIEKRKKKRFALASKVEKFSRVGVPTYFIVFVTLYWIITLS